MFGVLIHRSSGIMPAAVALLGINIAAARRAHQSEALAFKLCESAKWKHGCCMSQHVAKCKAL